eukprot:gene16883-23156_t
MEKNSSGKPSLPLPYRNQLRPSIIIASTSNNQLEASAHISTSWDHGLLYDIIDSERKDVNIDNYLENIEVIVDKFMKNDSVWDQKELLSGLDGIARKKDTLACLLRDVKEVKETLALLTKELKKDISKFLFAGEVPPNEMYKLLTQELNLTEKLSLALISWYDGGHIWDIYQALLIKSKKTFTPSMLI